MGKKHNILLLLISFIIISTAAGQNLAEEIIPSTLEYEILESGKPYGVEEAIGWTILLKEDIDTLSEDELIEFLLTISEGKRFVVLSVYLTLEAYNYERTSDVEKGHLLEYRKNIMSVDIGTHRHQIEWTQEVGKFAPKYLEYTFLPLDKWILNANQSYKK